ncbi:MAG TPA: hypothetical protein PLO51_00500 [Candidatus Micrarchaeota archaeon]|nr:hypothetical protein [Candidatus Micrarchaeota archaeon]
MATKTHFVTLFIAAALVSIALQTPVFAQLPDSQIIQVDYGKIGNLVSVASDFESQPIIPGYEYANNINVSWAIPNESLKNLNSQKVEVFVSVWSNSPGIVFDSGNGREKATSFSLYCNVAGDGCASGSVLQKNVKAYSTHASANGTQDEKIFVNATLTKSHASPLDYVTGAIGSIASDLGIKAPENISANATIALFANNQTLGIEPSQAEGAAQNLSSTVQDAMASGQSTAQSAGSQPQVVALAAIVAIFGVFGLLVWKFK